MASGYYFIKLYHEILDDPKMGRLPDNVWRRAIELFLYAGELDNDGHLPCSDDIAWRLFRQREADDGLLGELQHLADVGILEATDAGWLVVAFAKRQAAVSDAERQRQHRRRKQKRQWSLSETKRDSSNNGSVTNRDTDKIREDKNRLDDGTGPRHPPAAEIYNATFGEFPSEATWPDLQRVSNFEQWAGVCNAWRLQQYRPSNISGLLDWYDNGIPEYAQKGNKNGQGRINSSKQGTTRQKGSQGKASSPPGRPHRIPDTATRREAAFAALAGH